jgi:predicted nucleic acid-binding Zn ribbon protein
MTKRFLSDGYQVAVKRSKPERGKVYVDSPLELLRQLVDPVLFSVESRQSDYRMITGRPGTLKDGRYTVGKDTFTVQDGQIWYLGSLVCEACFGVGKLVPQGGCNEHTPRKCQHRNFHKKCRNGCRVLSFATFWSDRVDDWSAQNNPEQPWQVAKSCNRKFHLDCRECGHTFEASLNNVTSSNGSGCPYCSGSYWKPCAQADGAGSCTFCFSKSFASFDDPGKLASWSAQNGPEQPWQVAKSCHRKFHFDCQECGHTFEAALYSVTSPNLRWCPYCSGGKWKPCALADSTGSCTLCFSKSFASFDDPGKLASWSAQNSPEQPWQVAKSSGRNFHFDCQECGHTFEASLNNVTSSNSTWCPYCSGYRVCGEAECKFCDRPCEFQVECYGYIRKGRFRTQKTRKWVCSICLPVVLKNDPDETPLQYRAKVSIEIYCLAELQRLGLEDNSFLGWEPTAWDCPILPDCNSKPDNIWCFSPTGAIYEVAGACKIDPSQISYVLVLEVLEHGAQQHSTARSISDESREKQIRAVFAGIPVGFVYTVMANDTYHVGADPQDVFFHRDPETQVYSVLPGRLVAWQKRLHAVKNCLEELAETYEPTTHYK